jgi:hypothetical protein
MGCCEDQWDSGMRLVSSAGDAAADCMQHGKAAGRRSPRISGTCTEGQRKVQETHMPDILLPATASK